MEITNVEEYISNQKIIHNTILNFIENDYNIEENYNNIIRLIDEVKIRNDRSEIKSILYLLSKICNNHFRLPNFFSKIEQIIKYFLNEIKKNFSNLELYKIFMKNNRIVLFLIENQIITIDKSLALKISKNERNLYYFYPEIKSFLDTSNLQQISMENFSIEKFEKTRKIGENETHICELIRQDLIENFIIYVNKKDYHLKSTIEYSIFETNPFLIKNQPTLIEYAAFFGSIQIFRYLYLNKVKLTPSLWLFAIHSDNPELIQLLEEKKIVPNDKSYEKCLKESIKCHHNDVANYIQDNLLVQNVEENNDNINFKQNITAYAFHYYNFFYFPENLNHKFCFYYSCYYDYYNFVVFFYITPLHLAAKNDNLEIIDLLLNQPNIKILKNTFKNCPKLTEIKIPPKFTTIIPYAFSGCLSLTQVKIPPSVHEIGKSAFYECSSIEVIEIPSKVTSIGESAFDHCSSLKEIKTNCNFTKIGNSTFNSCWLLKEIKIPSSVSSIGSFAFFSCKMLKEITIPSSVASIDASAFNMCTSLCNISFITPSSMRSIGENAFEGCSALKEVKIPNSVTFIGQKAFFRCLSLKQLTVPYCINIKIIGVNPNVRVIRVVDSQIRLF